jgi:hypothetical protein
VAYFSATTLDIENRWRPLTTAEEDVAIVLLSDADLKLYHARPQLPAAIASTDPETHIDGQLAVIVLVDMVLRVLRNPDSFRTTNLGADGSVGVGYFSTEVLRPRVAIAPGDLDDIDRALRQTQQSMPIVASRYMQNVDYGKPESDTSTLPTP